MNISKRQSEILKILETNMYVSVNELSKLTYTSPSSIRRDLSAMQNVGLVKRSHGGVTLPDPIRGVASFYDRTHQNIQAKRLIATGQAATVNEATKMTGISRSVSSYNKKLGQVERYLNGQYKAFQEAEKQQKKK